MMINIKYVQNRFLEKLLNAEIYLQPTMKQLTQHLTVYQLCIILSYEYSQSKYLYIIVYVCILFTSYQFIFCCLLLGHCNFLIAD